MVFVGANPTKSYEKIVSQSKINLLQNPQNPTPTLKTYSHSLISSTFPALNHLMCIKHLHTRIRYFFVLIDPKFFTFIIVVRQRRCLNREFPISREIERSCSGMKPKIDGKLKFIFVRPSTRCLRIVPVQVHERATSVRCCHPP